MYLLNVNTLQLEEFPATPPPFAILSHTWNPPSEELSFQDVKDGNVDAPGKARGSAKVRGCCRQAKEDYLDYVWIDTCCIDQTNAVELSAAINSMFRWYQAAELCYVYLADVPTTDSAPRPGSPFHSSRWFTRGWTLQELLAPSELLFYDQAWRRIETKYSLASEIQTITGIPMHVLRNAATIQTATSIAQRMSWAANRHTTREEDRTYSLLGLFDVNIPMIYGEGKANAFVRLQQAILQKTQDDSLFAWGLEDPNAAGRPRLDMPLGTDKIWAAGPEDYANCGHIVVRPFVPSSLQNLLGGRLQMSLAMVDRQDPRTSSPTAGFCLGVLNCGPSTNQDETVCMPLQKSPEASSSDDFFRPRHVAPTIVSRARLQPWNVKTICVWAERVAVKPAGDTQNLVTFKYARSSCKFIGSLETYPTGAARQDSDTQISVELAEGWVAVRFRPDGSEEDGDKKDEDKKDEDKKDEDKKDEDKKDKDKTDKTDKKDRKDRKDIVLAVEFRPEKPAGIANCHVMVISQTTSLLSFTNRVDTLRAEAFGQTTAVAGDLSVAASLHTEGREGSFVVKLSRIPAPRQGASIVDADKELKHASNKYNLIQLLRGEKAIRFAPDTAETKTPAPFRSAWGESVSRAAAKRLAKLDEDIQAVIHKIDQLEPLERWLEDMCSRPYPGALQHAKAQDKRQVDGDQGLTATSGQSAIVQAVDDGRLLEAKLLLDRGASCQTLSPVQKGMLLLRALHHEDEAMARLLIERDALLYGKTPAIDRSDNLLYTAIKKGLKETAELMVDKGFPLRAIEPKAMPGLVQAAIDRGFDTFASRLLATDLKPTKPLDVLGPFNAAVDQGNLAMARRLLNHSDWRSPFSANPYFHIRHAARKGNSDMVALLLEHNTPYRKQAYEGDTLALAVRSGSLATVRLLVGVVRCADAADPEFTYAVIAAAARDEPGMVRLLCRHGADLGCKSREGMTALMHAAAAGCDRAVQALLDCDAEIDQTGKGECRTALAHAVKNGKESTVRLLLINGAKQSRSLFGTSPLVLAEKYGHLDIARMLLRN